MKYNLKAYSIHELGQRDNQEDSIFPALNQATSDDRLFILCDGMGGHDSGEVASAAVCEAMSQTVLAQSSVDGKFDDYVFHNALYAAYDSLDAKDNGAEKKMGTTMTFLKLHEGGAYVAHIGDSRVYQLRPATETEPARIVFATRDHSLVNDLIKVGELTEEEAKNFPRKNVITRAMQPLQENRSKADVTRLTDIRPGDYFYMCSDGMLEETNDENLLFLITKPDFTDEEKVEKLIRLTVDNKDNHTAHLIHITEVIGQIPAPVVTTVVNSVDNSVVEERLQAAPITRVTNRPAMPTPSKQKKNLTWLWILLVVLLLGAAAAGAWFLLGQNKDSKKETKDEPKKEQVEKENDPERERPVLNVEKDEESLDEVLEEAGMSGIGEAEGVETNVVDCDANSANSHDNHSGASHATQHPNTTPNPQHNAVEPEPSRQSGGGLGGMFGGGKQTDASKKIEEQAQKIDKKDESKK